MGVRLKQNKRIFIETDYDNIVVVNPNEVYNSNGKNEERLVDHEDLVYYANLETFIIPRTKLAIGESFDSPVVNTTNIATIFGGDDALKVNFLKPKGKTEFDTSWSNQLTGEGSLGMRGINQNTETAVNFENRKSFKKGVSNYEDTQLLGIKSISVNVKGTGVPEVSIQLVDIQGRSLFEQGENSLYSAFFNFPYPLFYLTLKGYYGKAVKYRLSLISFNASFDADSGNYNISLKLIGKFTALLFDTPLSYAVTAPKMYNTQIKVTDPKTGNKSLFNTYKGRQKLEEVYKIYKRKGLIPENFPTLSIEEFDYRVQAYDTNMKANLKDQADFTKLNDLQDFSVNLDKLYKEVYEYAINSFLDRDSFYVQNGQIYYPFKIDISLQSREDVKTKIQARITEYTQNLKENATFGEVKDAKDPINVLIKNEKDVIRKLDYVAWQNTPTDVLNTYLYRYPGRTELAVNSPEYVKFISDEIATAVLDTKTIDKNGEIVEDYPDFFVFGDKNVADGTYIKNSYLDKIDTMRKSLEAKQKIIEDNLSKFYAQQQLKQPTEGGLGFKPTIRNIFAIILAGADAFYRLMEDTHQDAWNVRSNKNRLLSVIPSEKNFSVDAIKSIQKSSTELNDDNVVYPWPLYFTLEKQADNSELYVIQYPGDAKYINLTRGYDYTVWPEVGFVEAYIKASVEKEKPTNNYTYNNPTDVTNYVSCNAIEFPFKTAPYQDLNAIKTFYEIFERSYLSSHYGNLPLALSSEKQIDKFYGDIESLNLSLVAEEDITINQNLKSFKFNLTTLIDHMKSISNNGQGMSWQSYIRDFFTTEYISNLMKDLNEIYSIDTINDRSIKVSADLPLADKMKEFLEDSETSVKGSLDTYPFTDLDWVKNNLANGTTIGDYEDFNNTTRSYVFLDDKKTIARINETEKYSSLKLFTTNSVFQNNNQTYLSNQNTNQEINSRLTMKSFFESRKVKDLYLTESFIDYGNSYSGNLGTFVQTTSLMNTPYFINSIVDGVTKEELNIPEPYVALGYLFLNSLPLITTREKIKDFTNNVSTDLDYLASTLSKYSSIHQVPYAWVLKYGSIWHRYKRYVEDKVDILDDVWKNFDYAEAYDPTGSSASTLYTVIGYDGEPNDIQLQTTKFYFDSNVLKQKTIFNVGFYPKVINSLENYLFQEDLITAYTPSNFSKLYDRGLRIAYNQNSTSTFGGGFDTTNPYRELIKQNIYTYRFLDTVTNSGKILLYPSMGGIPFDQSIYECFSEDNKSTEELYNNNSMYNGSVRAMWGMSNFGYFNAELIKKPKPTEYLKIIQSGQSLQNDFDLTNVDSKYSSIEEIFNLFDVELLNKMEEKFLVFCRKEPSAKDLKLNDEVIKPTYTNANGLTNANLKQLKYQIKNLFQIDKNDFEDNEENTDGLTLGKKQITTFYSSINNFLNFDCILKIGNPSNFDRKLFDSFSNLNKFQVTDKYTFNPYKLGTLQGDNSNVNLTQSLINNSEAWTELRKYVGFSTIPNVDYATQVESVFQLNPIPTTPTVSANTTPVIELRYFGDSSAVYSTPLLTTEYINVTKTNGQYQVFEIVGETNPSYLGSKIGAINFYQQNSNIEDDSNKINSSFFTDISSNYSFICNVHEVAPSNYQMVVDYYPSGFTSDKVRLIAKVSTYPQNSQTIPLQPTYSPLPPPLQTTEKSLVADFFIDNNIEFTKENVQTLYPLIRIYTEQKRLDTTFNKTKFTTFINDFLTDRYQLQDNMVNETFSNLNKILKNIEIDDGLPKNASNGDTTKLSLYNTLKGFNDKWIAGSDLKNNTLFEDFLFMDRANSDLGNDFTLDVKKVVSRLDLEKGQSQSLMSLISGILEDNYFLFMAMPAYVNFYGIQQALKDGQPLKDSEIGNSLFGTYLEVDYTESSPKFLCLYVGNPSEYPKPKENTFNRFGDDSFDLRVPDNPVRREDTNTNYSLSNKVVGFAVDFGIRNQNIFKGLELDMSEMKNTSESFKVFADMGSSVAGDKVAQQSQSLYSIYKSRSYACGVNSMGNAMIQPTMYFVLRHVPMFYGPYWITEVSHNVSERGFDTKFKGTRIPKYSLPKVDNLLASVNKDVISEIKKIAEADKKPKTETELKEEKALSENPPIQTLAGKQTQCETDNQYPTIPFVDLIETPFTVSEIAPLIRAATSDIYLRSLILGIAYGLMPGTTINNGVFNCMNNNPFEINTKTKFPGNLPTLIKEQSCVNIKNVAVPLVKFATLSDSIYFMVSFFSQVINQVQPLKLLNPDTNESKSYGKTLYQLAYTCWETPAAFGNSNAIPPTPPLTTKQIKEVTEKYFKDSDFMTLYNFRVESFTTAYKYFLQNPN
jgi:hypothetical protein